MQCSDDPHTQVIHIVYDGLLYCNLLVQGTHSLSGNWEDGVTTIRFILGLRSVQIMFSKKVTARTRSPFWIILNVSWAFFWHFRVKVVFFCLLVYLFVPVQTFQSVHTFKWMLKLQTDVHKPLSCFDRWSTTLYCFSQWHREACLKMRLRCFLFVTEEQPAFKAWW